MGRYSSNNPNKSINICLFLVFKNKDSLDKENYRPVSILSHRLNDFETLMYKQISNSMYDKLSLLLTGLKKNHNTQQCSLTMIEK